LSGGVDFKAKGGLIEKPRGFASGGLIDGFKKLADGGRIPGSSPTATADNIPIMATANEYMQPVSAVKYYGVQAMEAIRQRLIPRDFLRSFSAGGLIPRPAYALASGGSVPKKPFGGGGGNVYVSVTNKHPNAEVSAKQQHTGNGEINLEILVGQTVAKQMGQRSSAPSKVMRQRYGAQERLVQR
jgi:hypothetical protein